MRRGTVALAAVAVAATMGLASAGPAQAGTPPYSHTTAVWVHPGTAPLDGLGTFFYVAQPAAAGPTQGPPTAYEYSLAFHLEDRSFGILVLGHKNGQKVAGFGMVPSNQVSAVPYDWKYGQIYYLLTYRLSASQWGAWVYDWSAASWSLIGVQTVPESTGRMLPEVATLVDYNMPSPLPAGADTTCAYYPRTDALFYAPMGWRGDVITSATLAGNDPVGDCPVTTTSINGWQWHTVGQAAP